MLGGESAAGRAASGVLLLTGVGLVAYGSYVHFSVVAQLTGGHCDGCNPWHPLFVLGPLVLGGALILSAGYLLARR